MNAMRPIWLDYQQDAPGQLWPGLLLLISSLLLTGVLLNQYFTDAEKLASAGRQVSRLQHGAEQRLSGKSDTPQSEIAELRSSIISAERWESLFISLETASDDSMTLLGLELDPRKISITGEAKELAAAMSYVQRLQTATAFTNTHLTEYVIVKEHPRHPVRFTLIAEWREVPR